MEANPTPLTDDQLREKVVDVLHTCYDPEIPVDIYELGLIYDVRIDRICTPAGVQRSQTMQNTVVPTQPLPLLCI